MDFRNFSRKFRGAESVEVCLARCTILLAPLAHLRRRLAYPKDLLNKTQVFLEKCKCNKVINNGIVRLFIFLLFIYTDNDSDVLKPPTVAMVTC